MSLGKELLDDYAYENYADRVEISYYYKNDSTKTIYKTTIIEDDLWKWKEKKGDKIIVKIDYDV